MTRITVTLQVDVDLDAWTAEYGTTGAAESLTQALDDLRVRDEYLRSPKWEGLAKLHSATAVVEQPAAPAATALTVQERAHLQRALGRMPYAAGLTSMWTAPVATADVIETLEALADRLTRHVKDCQERDADLERHRDLIRGGRRLLTALLDATDTR